MIPGNLTNMNKATSRYPADWKEIALNIKEREGWHCYRCGILGLRPGERLFSPKDRAYLIQVHHWDCDPANNCSENLVALCTVCHLGMHRKHRGSILEGQGGLALIVEHRLPPPAMRRKPLPVQLGLWNSRIMCRQMELWDAPILANIDTILNPGSFRKKLRMFSRKHFGED
jgi:hypothetical protein